MTVIIKQHNAKAQVRGVLACPRAIRCIFSPSPYPSRALLQVCHVSYNVLFDLAFHVFVALLFMHFVLLLHEIGHLGLRFR
jgi:hypothetical protein